MKEFLNSKAGYVLQVLPEHAGDDPESGLIEVPEGADTATKDSANDIYFWKDAENQTYIVGEGWKICDDKEYTLLKTYIQHDDAKIVWARPTKVEELLFIDDEPVSKDEKEKEFFESFNDLPKVDKTLKERQSQYGDFNDVARTTGQLMAIIHNSANGQTMPYSHDEALHMICSKVARIVNGDYNNLDSWHDIGGYAKLIENIIDESEQENG